MKLPDFLSPEKSENKSTKESVISPEQKKFDVGFFTVANEKHPAINEDALLSLPELGAFAVLDGVGGRVAGNVASNAAKADLEILLREIPEGLSLTEIQERFVQIFKKINHDLLEKIAKDSRLSGMATTASLVKFYLDKDGTRKIITVSVGDSRVYVLKKNGVLEQITEDQNSIPAEVRAELNKVKNESELSAQGKIFLQRRHMVNGVLGLNVVGPGVRVVGFNVGEVVLVVSDGISDNLTDDEMASLVTGQASNESKARLLVEFAQKRSREKSFRSKADDMTAIVVSVNN